MSANVNLRSKKTSSEANALLGMWQARCLKVSTRKKYEREIEAENEKLRKDLIATVGTIASSTGTPIEIIIEENRCVLQKKMFFAPKAKDSEFAVTFSVDLPPISEFMKDEKTLNSIPFQVRKAIKRLNVITRKNLGKVVHPAVNPKRGIQDLARHPGIPMAAVTFNVRTRYDF